VRVQEEGDGFMFVAPCLAAGEDAER
jgi:hypothetical protein